MLDDATSKCLTDITRVPNVMSFKARHGGLEMRWMTWRAVSARPDYPVLNAARVRLNSGLIGFETSKYKDAAFAAASHVYMQWKFGTRVESAWIQRSKLTNEAELLPR